MKANRTPLTSLAPSPDFAAHATAHLGCPVTIALREGPQVGASQKELMNLRFTVSDKKVFEMLEGGGIYDKPNEVFIREVIQNAYDASKVQVWKDILYPFKMGLSVAY